jgi:hypothetical protein
MGFGHLHGLVEATKQAFLIRDQHVGDPAGMKIDPQALLDDGAAIDAMAARIDPARALAWPQPPSPATPPGSARSMARAASSACIQSHLLRIRIGHGAAEDGIVWQNRGSSFRLAESGWNPLRPDAQALSHAQPRARASFGTGGRWPMARWAARASRRRKRRSSRAMSATACLCRRPSRAPRWLLGRTWGEQSVTLKLEDRFPAETVAALRAAGHDLETDPTLHLDDGPCRRDRALIRTAAGRRDRSAQRRAGRGMVSGGGARSPAAMRWGWPPIATARQGCSALI